MGILWLLEGDSQYMFIGDGVHTFLGVFDERC